MCTGVVNGNNWILVGRKIEMGGACSTYGEKRYLYTGKGGEK